MLYWALETDLFFKFPQKPGQSSMVWKHSFRLFDARTWIFSFSILKCNPWYTCLRAMIQDWSQDFAADVWDENGDGFFFLSLHQRIHLSTEMIRDCLCCPGLAVDLWRARHTLFVVVCVQKWGCCPEVTKHLWWLPSWLLCRAPAKCKHA
jgi:hypothetical protein